MALHVCIYVCAARLLGAAVGCYLFGALEHVTSYPIIMVICGILCIIGAIISQLFIVPHDHSDHSDSSHYSPVNPYGEDSKFDARAKGKHVVISALEGPE